MAIPTVTNFDTDRIPVEGSPAFRADASYVWSTIPSVINSMNAAIDEQNNVNEDITTKHNTVVEKEALINPHYSAIDIVANNIVSINNVVTNMTEILHADDNAAIASTAANEASTSATIASSSAMTAEDAKDVVVAIKDGMTNEITIAIEAQMGVLSTTVLKNARKRKMNEFGIAL